MQRSSVQFRSMVRPFSRCSVFSSAMLLSFLTLAVIQGVFAAKCPGGYAPANTAIRRLGGTDPPISWHDVDWQCTVQFPGYEMLKRDFTKLSRAERELCRNEPVPLGLQQDKGSAGPIWRDAYDLYDVHAVSDKYLKHKKTTATPEDVSAGWRGVVDLKSSQWWLVPENATFGCAVCQRARRAQLNSIAARWNRPQPFTKAYTAQVRNIFFGEMTVPVFVNFIQEAFDKANAKIVVDSKSTVLLDGSRKYSLRLRSAKRLDSDDVQSLLAGFEVSSWKDMDYCPAFTSPLLDSTEVKIGRVASGKMPGHSRWISRDCVPKFLEDEDFDAVWDKTFQWVAIEKECPDEKVLDEYERILKREKRFGSLKSNLTGHVVVK